MSKADISHNKEPDNEELSVKYQTAKEKYTLNKRYYNEAIEPMIETTVTVAGGFTDFKPMDSETTALVTGWRDAIQTFYTS